MARKGNATDQSLISETAVTLPLDGYSWSLHYRSDTAPSTTGFKQPLNIAVGAGGSDERTTFTWNHTNINFVPSVTHFDGLFAKAKFTTSLLADTDYVIGGRYDGVNIECFLNGVSEDTDPTSDFTSGANATFNLLVDHQGSSWDNGEISHFVFYNVILSDAEMLMLGKRVSPILVRPQSILAYWRIDGNLSPEPIAIGTAGGLTVTGATKVDSQRIFMPSKQIIQFPSAAAGPDFMPASYSQSMVRF